MRILALNCGSSSLKFQIVEVTRLDGASGSEECLATGRIKVGPNGRMAAHITNGEPIDKPVSITTHAEGVGFLVDWLNGHTALGTGQLQAVGHRVVHGGDEFFEPTMIDGRVLERIEEAGQLAPLHNGPALDLIRGARSVLGDALPMVATFDTAFHKSLPACARRYAIPEALATKHRLWRYGFHGLAHRWMMERYGTLADRPVQAAKLISFQLGSGCSATAIREGQSVETSMGLTPLEGLMMATRSGDVDASLPGLLARREGVSLEQVEEWLNTRSGLLGVQGDSEDVRVILEAERQGDRRAALALEMFCHRARKYLGAYLAVLGGADAVLFGGGIGENQPAIRARICAGMSWCGLLMDEKRNDDAIGREARISADNSPMSAYVIPVNEEALIARDTFQCLSSAPGRKTGSRTV
jgi:acetate kinase